MANLKALDKIEILGPLGNGFNLNSKGNIAIISGGIGIAPMIYTMKSIDTPIDFIVDLEMKFII